MGDKERLSKKFLKVVDIDIFVDVSFVDVSFVVVVVVVVVDFQLYNLRSAASTAT